MSNRDTVCHVPAYSVTSLPIKYIHMFTACHMHVSWRSHAACAQMTPNWYHFRSIRALIVSNNCPAAQNAYHKIASHGAKRPLWTFCYHCLSHALMSRISPVLCRGVGLQTNYLYVTNMSGTLPLGGPTLCHSSRITFWVHACVITLPCGMCPDDTKLVPFSQHTRLDCFK